MHELSIALSILDAIEEQAARYGDVGVAAVHLRLGPLAGVVKEALISAFELAREGTPFPRCVLHVEETTITAQCPVCNLATPVRSIQDHRCVTCGSPVREILTGREMDLTAMEIEDGEHDADEDPHDAAG